MSYYLKGHIFQTIIFVIYSLYFRGAIVYIIDIFNLCGRKRKNSEDGFQLLSTNVPPEPYLLEVRDLRWWLNRGMTWTTTTATTTTTSLLQPLLLLLLTTSYTYYSTTSREVVDALSSHTLHNHNFRGCLGTTLSRNDRKHLVLMFASLFPKSLCIWKNPQGHHLFLPGESPALQCIRRCFQGFSMVFQTFYWCVWVSIPTQKTGESVNPFH